MASIVVCRAASPLAAETGMAPKSARAAKDADPYHAECTAAVIVRQST